MVSKAKVQYVCSECGFESAKWYGKCPGCGQWNCMEEELRTASSKKTSIPAASEITGVRSFSRPIGINEISSSEEERYHTGLSELDRVLGGGIVKGSLILISGDPVLVNPPYSCKSANISVKAIGFFTCQEKSRGDKLNCVLLALESLAIIYLL